MHEVTMDQQVDSNLRFNETSKDFSDHAKPVQSPLRMRYAAETKIFRAQYGGLEDIRQKLGFSRRKMCQLLLVDPSAWTRWMKDESRVPPHVYRALEWYLALEQKMLTQPDLARLMTARYGSGAAEANDLQTKVDQIGAELRRQKLISGLLTAATALLFAVSSWLVYK